MPSTVGFDVPQSFAGQRLDPATDETLACLTATALTDRV